MRRRGNASYTLHPGEMTKMKIDAHYYAVLAFCRAIGF